MREEYKNFVVIDKLTDTKGSWEYYRKKPVIIKAVKLQEETVINTLEGDMRGNVGDYLIKGVNGELYPCKPDIFHKTYEKVKQKDGSLPKSGKGSIEKCISVGSNPTTTKQMGNK